MKKRKFLSGLICSIMAVSATIGCFSASVSSVDDEAFIDLNQSQIVAEMGAGWNLGNQLEAPDQAGFPNETAYGNPVIKKELIQAVKKAGFKSIRIPVSYLNRIGNKASGYKIEEDWLNRIKEVVDYAINEDLYVIINMHGDGYVNVKGSWLLCNKPENEQVEIRNKYQACWQQIATKFKEYDEHLIFESMNEEFDGSYSTPNRTYYENINKYNQIFIDTIRQTGGNNAKRWLLICGWNTNIEYATGNYGFEFPTDTHRDSSISENRIMMSVHYYDPWDFSGDDTDGKYSQWGKDANPSKTTSYSNTEIAMEKEILKVYNKFVRAGYPVIIGEYGCINKVASDPVNTVYRAHYNKTMSELSKKYGCVPVYWDNAGVSNSFGLFNRKTYALEQPEIVDAIMSVFLTPKENLDRCINNFSSLDSNSYTSKTWSDFSTALQSAKSIAESSGTTDEKYTTTYETLCREYYKLMPSENYLKEQVVATDSDIDDSSTVQDSEGLFLTVKSDTLNVKLTKSMNIKFKVTSGNPSSNDNIFTLKPFSDNNWDGWNDNFIKLSECTYNNTTKEYTITVDPQKILKSYTGTDTGGANGINFYYSTKGTSTNIQLTYCSLSYPITHTDHHYEITDETYTCTSNGTRTYTCIACGDVQTEDFKASHKWDNGTVTSEATCTSSGTKVYTCIVCETTKNETLSAAGHCWGEWNITKEATCTENGSKEHTCKVCDEKQTETIKATGHNYIGDTCTVCGNKKPTQPSSKPTTKTPSVVKTTNTPAATRDPKKVAADKKAAQKAMKQAKLTSLKVKSKAKKKINVTWKKVKKAKGYQVQVSAKKNFKKVIFKKDLKKTKLNIKNKKIKSKKTYYVRVRAYAEYKNANNKTIKVFSKWNKKLRKVKVK